MKHIKGSENRIDLCDTDNYIKSWKNLILSILIIVITTVIFMFAFDNIWYRANGFDSTSSVGNMAWLTGLSFINASIWCLNIKEVYGKF